MFYQQKFLVPGAKNEVYKRALMVSAGIVSRSRALSTEVNVPGGRWLCGELAGEDLEEQPQEVRYLTSIYYLSPL